MTPEQDSLTKASWHRKGWSRLHQHLRMASAGIDAMTASKVKGATAGNLVRAGSGRFRILQGLHHLRGDRYAAVLTTRVCYDDAVRTLSLLLTVVSLASLTACSPPPKPESKALEPAPPSAAVAGQKFQHDGVDFYYEVHGSGEPLLLIHGNGGSSRDFTAQIRQFARNYQVIAMDSRDQGRSGDSSAKITYEKMTDDQAALLDHLKLGPVNVVGWSDGGIEALLLGIRHPGKVKKLVSMAANLTPQGLHPDSFALIKDMLKDPKIPARDRKVTEMMLTEPQIKLTALEKIKAPVLILASDHDLVSDEHTLDIYHHIPSAQLQIFANATHMIPVDDPERFHSVVAVFLQKPFVKIDRLGDTMKSLEKLRTAATK